MSCARAFARVAICALATAACCPHTHAADAPTTAEHDCNFADFTPETADQLRAATVKADTGARVYFSKGGGDCPGDSKSCRDKRYLVAGDQVVLTKRLHGFACAWYERKNVNEYIVGWLPTKALDEIEAPASPPSSAWIREWSRFVALGNQATLTISADAGGDSLHIVGEALWLSSASAAGPHTGEFDGVGKPRGNHLSVKDNDGECVLDLFLLDDNVLFVQSHGICGGMNVRFDGLY